jgi:hypothetical protein
MPRFSPAFCRTRRPAVQSEYSLWTRDVEEDAIGAMRELGVGFVPYSPLGRGFLTATVDLSTLDASDFRRRNPRFSGDAATANAAIVDAVRSVADAKGVAPAQIALAWVYAQADRLGVPRLPSRAPSGSSGWSRTSPPWTSRSPPANWPSSTRSAARSSVPVTNPVTNPATNPAASATRPDAAARPRARPDRRSPAHGR